jgi:hypothetical protein
MASAAKIGIGNKSQQRKDQKMICQNCGSEVAPRSEVIAAVRAEYNFTDEEIESGKVVTKVFHPACAVADGRIDSEDDLNGAEFYWDAYEVS